MNRGYFGSGVAIGLPMRPYFASIPRRIFGTSAPAARSFITSRVMSVQTPHVAAWLVNVTRSGADAFT